MNNIKPQHAAVFVFSLSVLAAIIHGPLKQISNQQTQVQSLPLLPPQVISYRSSNNDNASAYRSSNNDNASASDWKSTPRNTQTPSEWKDSPLNSQGWSRIDVPPGMQVVTEVWGTKPVRWRFRVDGYPSRGVAVSPGAFKTPEGQYSVYEYALQVGEQDTGGVLKFRFVPRN